ncbi:hypothetical protein SKAU_G00239120 [Synaphobranchus kaupii]|uniref:CCHC-type domain-containing protein n=1 Tax=Synaphobranchus kaupii TaxID=118154 RepID=A0A9Q1IU49_SYNKA|nr:hypothetical protein SKAU_G00239120 [Synaphobranchus kaupii]
MNSRQPPFCRRCMQVGNINMECDKVVCHNCGKKGHMAVECREPKACNICGSEEHLMKGCPERRPSYEDALTGGVSRDLQEAKETENEAAGQSVAEDAAEESRGAEAGDAGPAEGAAEGESPAAEDIMEEEGVMEQLGSEVQSTTYSEMLVLAGSGEDRSLDLGMEQEEVGEADSESEGVPTLLEDIGGALHGAKRKQVERKADPTVERPAKAKVVKERIKEFCVAYGKIRRREEKARVWLSQKELQYWMGVANRGGRVDSEEVKRVKSEIREHYNQKAKGFSFMARVERREKDEKVTAFFFKSIKTRQTTAFMETLRSEQGEVVEQQDKLDAAVRFYSALFRARERNVSEGDRLVSQLWTKVKSGKQEALGKDIVREEVREAVFALQNGKTPGRDGIPKELYAAFWEIMGEDLVEVLNELGKQGKMPSSMREGIIHLLYKKGDRKELGNWRPVTLLCVDCKVLGKVLANRAKGLPWRRTRLGFPGRREDGTMEGPAPESFSGGVRLRNTLRVVVALPRRQEVDLSFVIVKVFKEIFSVGVSRMYCIQDFQARGFFDVTLDSESLCLEVFEMYKALGPHKVLSGISFEPLFSFDVKLVTDMVYNPFVSGLDVELFLKQYCTILRAGVRLKNSFGVWNGKRLFLVRLRRDVAGLGGLRHLPAVFSIGPDKGFLTYTGLPTYCRRCFRYGHMAKDCSAAIVCSLCGAEGHVAKDCKQDKRYHLCGSTEHLFRNCPDRRQSFAEAVRLGRPPPGGEAGVQQQDRRTSTAEACPEASAPAPDPLRGFQLAGESSVSAAGASAEFLEARVVQGTMEATTAEALEKVKLPEMSELGVPVAIEGEQGGEALAALLAEIGEPAEVLVGEAGAEVEEMPQEAPTLKRSLEVGWGERMDKVEELHLLKVVEAGKMGFPSKKVRVGVSSGSDSDESAGGVSLEEDSPTSAPGFTWGNSRGARSRLDYLFVPGGQRVSSVEVIPLFFSDHSGVRTTVGFSAPKFGKSFWKLNVQVLEEEAFCNRFVSLYRSWGKLKPFYGSVIEWWEMIKERTRGLVKGYCKGKRWREQRYLVKLQGELGALYTAWNLGGAFDMERWARLKEELKVHFEGRARSFSFKSQGKGWEKDERCNSYFFQSVQARRVKRVMQGLRGVDGRVWTGAEEMVGATTVFYRELFGERGVDRSAREVFLGLIEERVPGDVCAALELPFSLEELHRALMGMKSRKVPGGGGVALKVSQYADDLTLFLGTERGLETALGVVEDFSRGSGALVNVGKSQFKFFGTWRSRTDPLYGLRLCEGPLRILGVDFAGGVAEDAQYNWERRLAGAKRKLGLWSTRCLTISGPRRHTFQFFLHFWFSGFFRFLVEWDNRVPRAEKVPTHIMRVVRWAKGHKECRERDLVLDHRRLYRALRGKLMPAGGLGVGVGKGVWAVVQAKGLENKLKDLNWLVAYRRLPVREVLYCYGLTEDRFCTRVGCATEMETVQHVFWGCGFAQDVWGLVKARYRVVQGVGQEGVLYGEDLGGKKGRESFLTLWLLSMTKHKLWVARGERGSLRQGWTARGVVEMVRVEVERRFQWEVRKWGFNAARERWKVLL